MRKMQTSSIGQPCKHWSCSVYLKSRPDLSFSKKLSGYQNSEIRNFSWRVSVETWYASCLKKGLLEKQQGVPNIFKFAIFSELSRCIFQISVKCIKLFIPKILKCIKLFIPKILFILVLCNFNVYFKITFLKILPPSQSWKQGWGRVHAMSKLPNLSLSSFWGREMSTR